MKFFVFLHRIAGGRALSILALLAGLTAFVGAAEFDFPRVMACREVVDKDASLDSPDEKVIELALRLSVRFVGDDARHVQEIAVDIDAAQAGLRVYDFAPTTTLTSDLADEIERTTTTERSRSLDATLGGGIPVAAGNLIAHVTPSVSGGLGKRETNTVKTSRRPPRYATVVSGTTRQGHGVFYKLRRNSQTTLEGVHEFSVRFIVPDDWDSSTVRVACLAHGRKKVLWMDQPRAFGHMVAPMEIYLAGDSEMPLLVERRNEHVQPCGHSEEIVAQDEAESNEDQASETEETASET